MADERIIFFHRPEEEYGFLSNLYPSTFQYEDYRFDNAEQYLTFMKAHICGDEAAEEEVMQADEPRRIRRMRRRMDQEKEVYQRLWPEIRQEVARWGVRQKFLQNQELYRQLEDTHYALLAEASDANDVWAIGLPMEEYKKYKPGNWKGQNLMGKVLMDVRRELRVWETVHEEDILEGPLGNMRLAEIVRLPGAANPMNVYAAIAMHANPGVFQSKEDFFYSCGKLSELKEAMDTGSEQLLPPAGFYEMLFELNEKYRHGKL
ncbi:MAG: NADAR family protein [Clostridia bacterium]|nr:NADAR family protein [Clostridia bacterium]